MPNDLKYGIEAQDNLTPTLNKIKQGLTETGNSATKLDKIKERFEKIESSTAPLKRQLRDLQTIMAQMKFEGLDNTAEFQQIAEYAGKVKDSMSDAATAVKAFANDTATLQAATTAVQGIAGGFTAATGVMNLFGVESENVKNAILKVQAAMAILNGVQTVANALNKDSALMLKLKSIALKTNTRDLAANTASEAANSAANAANTVTQNAWNIAKAIGKALLGDFTGLLIVGAAAIIGTTVALSSNTDEQEKNNKAVKDSLGVNDRANQLAQSRQKVEEDMASSIASSAAKQITNYTLLQRKWKECGDDIKKQQQFLSDYRTELDNTGFAIKNVYDAHEFLVTQKDKVVEYYFAIAKAAAAAAVAEDAFKRKIERQAHGTVANGGYYHTASTKTTNRDISGDEYTYLAGQSDWRELFSSTSSADWTLTEKGATRLNKYRNQKALELRKELDAEDDAVIDVAINVQTNSDSQSQTLLKEIGLGGTGGGGGGGRTTGGRGGGNTKKYEDFSIEYYKALNSQIDKELSSTNKEKLTEEKINELLKKKAENEGIIADIKEKQNEASLKMLKDEIAGFANEDKSFKKLEEKKKVIDEIDDLIESQTLNLKEEADLLKYQTKLLKEIETEQKGRKAQKWLAENPDALKGKMQSLTVDTSELNLKKGVKLPDDALMEFYNRATAYLSQLQEKYSAGIIDKDAFLNEWKVIEDALKKEGLILTIHPELQPSEMQETLDNAANTLGELGGVISQMGQMANDDALNAAGVIAQAIANVWLAYSKASVQAASLGPWAWVGFSVGALAQAIGIISAINANKFAEGGVVGGHSYYGDKILARLNSGELVLNQKQQANLFKMINDGVAGTTNGQITFKLRGSDIYGSLKNYTNIKSKSSTIKAI